MMSTRTDEVRRCGEFTDVQQRTTVEEKMEAINQLSFVESKKGVSFGDEDG